MEANIDTMNNAGSAGFDVIIICTSTTSQAQYWQDRLDATKGVTSPSDAIIIGVDEDWNGKAGNGMGTLYAFVKASQQAATEHGIDLQEKLAAGEISVAIYHTAGKGTRLAPIHLAENSNKPGVKLPALLELGQTQVPMTILEAVIKQTGSYAASRKGRVSVFWGDQVFVPSVPVAYKPTAHVDLLAQLGPMLTEQEWKERGMHKYGLIAINAKGEGAQVEKVDHATATKLLSSLGTVTQVGTSLGSFSMSHALVQAMLKTFKPELDAKSGEMDTDPHFWMPMTLSLAGYVKTMESKEMNEAEATKHWKRVQSMTDSLKGARRLALLGAVDIGTDALWVDYGNIISFYDNVKLLTYPADPRTPLLNKFLGIDSGGRAVAEGEGRTSVILATTVYDDSKERANDGVRSSVLVDVHAQSLQVEEAVIIGTRAKSIKCKKCIIYGVSDPFGDLHLKEGTIMAEVTREDGTTFRMTSDFETDGKKAWKKKVHGNEFSFDDVHKMNMKADLGAILANIHARDSASREAFATMDGAGHTEL
jgi:hypothetical protein